VSRALGRDGAWDSALSVDEFAALRSVGFEPAGQVFGAAVYYLSAVAGVSCPGRSLATMPGPGIPGGAARITQALYDGRRTAIDRMTAECEELGGYGIVGATLQVREIPSDSFTAGAAEFTVIGTAVRADGCPPPTRPFTTELGAQDFAKLLMAGWVPAGIALGISVAGLHDDLPTTSSGPWGRQNAEVPAYTELMVQARQDARTRLEEAVAGLGGDGAVVSAMTLHVRSDACQAHPGGTDHFVQAIATGTAVARFADRPATNPRPSLGILRLG
jgi:uncharacterized protein YbjQ (UPF0145 family)